MGFYGDLAARWPAADRSAIVTEEGTLSYGELQRRVERAAGWLAGEGLEPGDVLALQLPRCVELLTVHLAALASGVATLPLNPEYTPRETAYYLEDSGARRAVLPADLPALRGALAAAPPRSPPDPPRDAIAALLYTSGTTGRPKGARITHANLAATVLALHEAWRWTPEDTLLHALPLFHIHGLFVAQHGALYAGATARWMRRFDARAALRELERCTVFMGVPTFYHRLLQLPADARADLARLRLATSGSAPLSARDHQAFQERFGPSIVERYGMTEAGIALSNPYDGERRPGSVGLPLRGVEARIVGSSGEDLPDGEVGELALRAPSVFAGYHGRPDATAAALRGGWLWTGDLAYRSPDGYHTLVGRASDLVISGGLNVYPAEVEGALLEHPAVAEAAALGVPDPEWGERVVAAVVAAPGAALDLADLAAHCRERLAPYKRPRDVRAVAALPRNALGKVVKGELRSLWAGLPR